MYACVYKHAYFTSSVHWKGQEEKTTRKQWGHHPSPREILSNAIPHKDTETD